MKKISFLLFLSMMSLFISAQTIEQIYHFDNPIVSEIQSYNQIQFDGCMQTATEGNPSLPYKAVSLLLPYGSEAASVEVVLSDFEEITLNKQLFPYQAARPYSKPERKAFVKNEELYSSKGVYPTENHGVLTTHYLNGHAFAFTSFTPVQYEPSSGKVFYAKTATVRVNVASAKNDNTTMLWNTPYINSKVKALADNPEMLSTYKTRGRNISAYDMLIITSEDYVEGFKEYMEYYESIGVRNRIITVSDIYASTQGADNQEKIRNYIIQEYSTNGIIMVLMGGDVNIVPYRGLYATVQSSSVYTDSNIPADLYFSALDGTWNDNNNTKWGEIGEDDLLPEIGIARMSFDNASKQANMINKTLKYQREPVLGEFRTVAMGGEWLYENPETYGSDYLELLIGERDDNGYTTKGIPEDYNFIRHYAENGTWGPTKLRNTINEGVQYVQHVGHANTNTVAEWYNSDITDSNFSGANGVDHNYTFFHSHGCVCGSFEDDCIMERMVTIQNFAVAAIGNSRYGWFNEGQTEGPAAHLHREMVDAQYNDRIPFLGMQFSDAKCQTAPFVNAPGQWEEGALRWNFYDLNVLGDVAVRPWLDEPYEANVQYQSEILLGSASMEVVVKDNNGKAQKGFRCSIVFEDEVIGFATTDENGVAEITFEGGLGVVGDMKLYVLGLNAYPAVMDVTALPSNTAYVVYNEYALNDDNNQIDYNEAITMDMTFANVGTVNAENVTATLSTENSEYIEITNATANIGNVNANSNITIEDAFSFKVSDNVPNNTDVRFIITCSDGSETWTSKINTKIYAPELEIINPASAEVNPGESATIQFNIANKGNSAAANTVFRVFCSFPETTVEEDIFYINTLDAGANSSVDFTFAVNESAAIGTAYEMIIAAYSGNYITTSSYTFTIGSVTESFETGDFSAYNWEFEGDANWTIATDQVYDGQYSVKSGDIGGSSSTRLKIVVEVKQDSEITFYKKVSSELSYDFLNFYVNNSKKGSWSGELGWSKETYTLTAGTHTLRWEYEKDYGYDEGEDCVWIDNIKFPPTAVVVDVETVVEQNIEIYPNPNKGVFNIELGSIESTVTIYNTMGQVVYQNTGLSNKTEIKLDNINSGLYFVNINNSEMNITEKVIIK